MRSRLSFFLSFVLAANLASSFCMAADAPKKYSSPVVTKSTPGHRVDIEINIKGAKSLVLEVTDGGNGSGYDWADWIAPRLIGPKGEKKLTELKWRQNVGRVEVNKNQAGEPLKVDGKTVENGLGVHARSLLVYELPAGYETFKAQGGLDNGGTDQAGSTTSVVFHASTSTKLVGDTTAPEGFQVDVLYNADIGKVGSWVALAVDKKGRLVTSDRQGKMYRIELPPVDSDAQAKVEEIKVDIGGANGILDAFGSLFVVGKGYGSRRGKDGLYRLTDTNNDDNYDKVEHLISLQVGSDHHAHAVLVHPDGKRLVILSGNSTNLPSDISTRNIRNQLEDQLLPHGTYYGHNRGRLAPAGFVLVCEPDGTGRRIHCAGFRNPYDFAFNREGELFTFDADMEYDVGGPWYRPTRVNHTVSGADFGWRWGAGKFPNYYPDSVEAIVDIGRGSPTGVIFGYGAKFPARYQDALYVCDWTYGRIFAVHITPDGSTYKGESEPFIQGRGMPVSDIVVHPDGAMYYVTGGRRQRTRLFRVTYTGSESTDPANTLIPSGPEVEMRRVRRSLEAFHGNTDAAAVEAAWPHLSHSDRHIRFAARTAIEHQAVDTWADRALTETNVLASIESAIALARFGGKEHRYRLLAKLNRINFGKLELSQKLSLLRAYGLVFIRLGGANATTTDHLISTLNPLFPSGERFLDHELSRMLLYLKAPEAPGKSVQLLLASDNQADEMYYSYHLRTISDGWKVDDLAAYFGWINAAQANSGDYVGGGHFRNFLKTVRDEATKRLSGEHKAALASILDKKPTLKRVKVERKFVQKWNLETLEPALARVDHGRAFIRGKKISEDLCMSCHLFKGKGGAVGPDLTSVGSKMDYKALLVEIMEPSRVISDQHASEVFVLKNGSVVEGRVVGGDDSIVHVAADAKNPEKITEVKTRDIAKREKSKTSLMPQDLLNVLDREEILDLLMYLSSGGNAGNTAFDR